MANTNDNKFLDVLNDTVLTGGYTSQSKKTYAPSTKVQSVKIEAILRNIKNQFANGSDVYMEGLAQINTLMDAMGKLKDACTEFQATEKAARDERQTRYASYNNHPTIEATPLNKVVKDIA